jgi:hypothetical protein
MATYGEKSIPPMGLITLLNGFRTILDKVSIPCLKGLYLICGRKLSTEFMMSTNIYPYNTMCSTFAIPINKFPITNISYLQSNKIREYYTTKNMTIL